MTVSTRHPAAAEIRKHLAQTGTSMRALSLQLGFGEKWVADFLCGRVGDPDPERLLARPSRKKMEQFIPIGEICRIGFDLMDKAERMLPTRRPAALYRDGLLMLLLAFRPKRIANIRSLKIGESLIFDEDGAPTGLSFDRTKNGDASQVSFPMLDSSHASVLGGLSPPAST